MKTLFILNHPPYGTEHCYNALRLAGALIKNDPEGDITGVPDGGRRKFCRKGQPEDARWLL